MLPLYPFLFKREWIEQRQEMQWKKEGREWGGRGLFRLLTVYDNYTQCIWCMLMRPFRSQTTGAASVAWSSGSALMIGDGRPGCMLIVLSSKGVHSRQTIHVWSGASD